MISLCYLKHSSFRMNNILIVSNFLLYVHLPSLSKTYHRFPNVSSFHIMLRMIICLFFIYLFYNASWAKYILRNFSLSQDSFAATYNQVSTPTIKCHILTILSMVRTCQKFFFAWSSTFLDTCNSTYFHLNFLIKFSFNSILIY